MTFKTLSDLSSVLNKDLGVTEWRTISQPTINAFAEATQDDQWIHTDVERSKQFSPFGTTIAHGFLTLSMISGLLADLVAIESVKMGVNYGLNRVRFTSHVPAGSRIRMRAKLIGLEAYQKNGVKLTAHCEVEREGSEKPVCVAEFIGLLFE